MTEPPKEHPCQDRIDLVDESQRPRYQQDHDLGRDSHRGQQPHDDRGQHAVDRQRRADSGALALPDQVGPDEDPAPTPRSDDQQRRADVKGGVGLEWRVKGVENGRLPQEDRHGR